MGLFEDVVNSFTGNQPEGDRNFADPFGIFNSGSALGNQGSLGDPLGLSNGPYGDNRSLWNI